MEVDDVSSAAPILVSLLALAARNIARQVMNAPGQAILIVCSREKERLARAIAAEIEAQSRECDLLRLGDRLDVASGPLRALVESMAEEGMLVLLLEREHAPFFLEIVGRPDQELKIPAERFFCDWCMRPAGVVRTYGIDMVELQRFREALLTALDGARQVRITSEAGTDIAVHPRGWRASHGEVFTAPDEGRSNGVIHVDGCAYWGPPAVPFVLRIERGRVMNLDELCVSDEQQRWVKNDMARDEGASVVAELGIGANLGAQWDEDLMEAEQARGTCHFGFGHNIAYGGQNVSSYHLDLVIRHPIIEVDGQCICHAGRYGF